METSGILFAGRSALRVRALLLGARFDLRTWPEAETIHRAPLAVKLDAGMAVLFRYGVAVLLGASPDAERALRERLSARTGNPYDSVESEELDIRIDPARPEGLKHIGAMLLIESRMVGRAQIGDKAELLWDHPELEGLNALLEDEFEIHERLAALDRKLELVARTERTIVDLISTRHSLRVEWYIVSLIVLEILLTIYQLWLQ
jgi:uncharacterized Rmd1/YagE family protein